MFTRSYGRGMNSGHGCYVRRVGAARVAFEKPVGSRAGGTDLTEVDERLNGQGSAPFGEGRIGKTLLALVCERQG